MCGKHVRAGYPCAAAGALGPSFYRPRLCVLSALASAIYVRVFSTDKLSRTKPYHTISSSTISCPAQEWDKMQYTVFYGSLLHSLRLSLTLSGSFWLSLVLLVQAGPE